MSDRPVMAGGHARLTRLDGLRGLAAVGVALYHMNNVPQLPINFGGPLGWLFGRGWTLVDLFFVLSGYVFAHVYGGPGQLRKPGALGAFWVARVARLWPLHLATLVLIALFSWGGRNNLGHFLLHLVMLQDWDLDTARSFNPASWSLMIEMLCYALFALGARAGDRVLLWVSLLTVLGSAWWLMIVGYPGGPWFGEVIPRGLLGFFTGQLLWRGRSLTQRLPWPLLVAALACGIGLEYWPGSPILPLGLLAWPGAVLLALRLPVLDRHPIGWLGERSFGLYMVHMSVIKAIDTLWPPQGLGAIGFAVSQSAIAILVLLAAETAYRLVEVPGRRLIRGHWAAWSVRDRGISAMARLISACFSLRSV